MRKILSLALLLATGPLLQAQQQYIPFPTSNAEWNIAYYVEVCEGNLQQHICYYHLAGDTTFNGHTYSKVSLTEVVGGDAVLVSNEIVGGIREEDKKVYYHAFNHSYLGSMFSGRDAVLYDFNVAVGDTVVADTIASYANSIIENIDSINLGGVYRKRIKTSRTLIASGRDEYWIEGLGSFAAGLITPLTDIPTCGHRETKLICYKQNGNVVYFNSEFANCDGLSIHETPKAALIKIYPNPALSNDLYIGNVDPTDGLQARVTDYTGRVLLTQALTQRENTIKLPGQVPFCILVLSDKSGQAIRVEKVINR